MNNKEASTNKKPNIFLRLLALLITASLIAGALALVIHRDRLNLQTLEHWLTYRNLDTQAASVPFTHPGGEAISTAYLNDGILFSSVSGAHYYSPSGELYTEQVLSMEHPILSAGDRCGVVYDAGGQSLFLFRQAQQAFSLSLEGNSDLLSARVNDSGWLTVTAQQSGYKGAVTVYDNNYEKVIQISLSSTFVVDAALSPDCKTVAVATISQKGGSFSSQILLYPINQTQPSSTLDLGNMMVLDMDFESELLWILGEEQLTTIHTNDNSMYSYSFGQQYLKGCDLDGDGFALLLLGRYRTGNADTAITIDKDAQELASLSLNKQVLDFDCNTGYCSLLTGSDLSIYNPFFALQTSFEDTQGARYTALDQSGNALLANSQQAWLYISSK